MYGRGRWMPIGVHCPVPRRKSIFLYDVYPHQIPTDWSYYIRFLIAFVFSIPSPCPLSILNVDLPISLLLSSVIASSLWVPYSYMSHSSLASSAEPQVLIHPLSNQELSESFLFFGSCSDLPLIYITVLMLLTNLCGFHFSILSSVSKHFEKKHFLKLVHSSYESDPLKFRINTENMMDLPSQLPRIPEASKLSLQLFISFFVLWNICEAAVEGTISSNIFLQWFCFLLNVSQIFRKHRFKQLFWSLFSPVVRLTILGFQEWLKPLRIS